MNKMQYCPTCDRNILARKKFYWSALILLSLTTGIGGIVYVLIWLFLKYKCPRCGGKC